MPLGIFEVIEIIDALKTETSPLTQSSLRGSVFHAIQLL